MLAAGLSGLQWMSMGLAILVLTWTVRRRVRMAQIRGKEPLELAQAELERVESSVWGKVQTLETRLHDFARQNEAELQTSLSHLQELIVTADAMPPADTHRSSDSQTGLIRCLSQAGYSPQEVSVIGEISLDEVMSVLQPTNRKAA